MSRLCPQWSWFQVHSRAIIHGFALCLVIGGLLIGGLLIGGLVIGGLVIGGLCRVMIGEPFKSTMVMVATRVAT